MSLSSPVRIAVAIILSIGASLILSSDTKAGSFADAITRAGNLQGRIMWCDAEANQDYLAIRENVAEVVRRCKESGINTIVVDVKPLSGYVLYKSKIAPRLADRAGVNYPKNYDLLKEMIDEGHKQGLKVHAAINVFSEASQTIGSGTAFDHPDWQCVNYEISNVARTAGAEFTISGTDAPMESGRLYVFTRNLAVPLGNTALGRVVIDSAGIVINKFAPTESVGSYLAPDGSRVLAGSGLAADWLTLNAAVCGKVDMETRNSFVPVGKSADQHMAVFVNPANRAVRDYELSVIKEIAGNYEIDGLILDRMRYPGIYADFSDLSRQKFEAWLGKKVERWPEDILRRAVGGGSYERGKYFNQWTEWRAHQIREFLGEAKSTLKAEKPSAKLGVYVGSWYSEYYDVGVNWGSPQYVPSLDWTTSVYNTAGYANLVDYMCAGCYYPYATREDAKAQGKPEWSTVEAAAQGSNEVVMDDTFVYASVYLLDYNNKPDAFLKAVQACLSSSQGVMLFDLVYVRKYGWWDLLKQALGEPVKAPHDVPGLLQKVQEVRKFVKSQEGN